MSALSSAQGSNQRNLKFIAAGLGAVGGLATAVLGVGMGGGHIGASSGSNRRPSPQGRPSPRRLRRVLLETSEASPTVSATTPPGLLTPH